MVKKLIALVMLAVAIGLAFWGLQDVYESTLNPNPEGKILKKTDYGYEETRFSDSIWVFTGSTVILSGSGKIISQDFPVVLEMQYSSGAALIHRKISISTGSLVNEYDDLYEIYVGTGYVITDVLTDDGELGLFREIKQDGKIQIVADGKVMRELKGEWRYLDEDEGKIELIVEEKNSDGEMEKKKIILHEDGISNDDNELIVIKLRSGTDFQEELIEEDDSEKLIALHDDNRFEDNNELKGAADEDVLDAETEQTPQGITKTDDKVREDVEKQVSQENDDDEPLESDFDETQNSASENQPEENDTAAEEQVDEDQNENSEIIVEDENEQNGNSQEDSADETDQEEDDSNNDEPQDGNRWGDDFTNSDETENNNTDKSDENEGGLYWDKYPDTDEGNYQLSLDKMNVEYCRRIEAQDLRTKCEQEIYESLGQCSSLTDELRVKSCKNMITYRNALASDRITLCSSIVDDTSLTNKCISEINNTLYEAAIAAGDSKICSAIYNAGMQARCIMEIDGE